MKERCSGSGSEKSACLSEDVLEAKGKKAQIMKRPFIWGALCCDGLSMCFMGEFQWWMKTGYKAVLATSGFLKLLVRLFYPMLYI